MNPSPDDPDGDLLLLDEIVLGSARGGKRPSVPLMIEVVRELRPDDLPALVAPPPVGARSGPGLQAIRHAHHQLAQLLAQGEEQAHISLITGYSPAYISNIKHDPAFNELVNYYETERAEVFHDVLERMKTFGLTVMGELQGRLADDPKSFSNRELMELQEQLLIKSKQTGPGNGQGAGGVNISVSFVEPKHLTAGTGPIINNGEA